MGGLLTNREKETGHIMEETQLDIIQRELEEMSVKVNQLHEVVTTLLSSIGQAQQAGGMAGMMARQFPDMTGFLPTVPGV